MNDATRESMEYVINERNRLIDQLRREIDSIYTAAIPLIELAKNTPEGREALSKWDSTRPTTHYGEKK